MKTDRDPTPLARAVADWIAHEGLTRQLDIAGAVEHWAGAVGPQIAAVTRAIGVTTDNTLMVRVATHGWATELGLMTPKILARLNADHKGRILHIRWIVGPLDRE